MRYRSKCFHTRKWHKWFAWYPVWIGCEWVWWETIERKKVEYGYDWDWAYRNREGDK